MGLFSSIKDNLHNAYQVIAREDGTEEFVIWRHPTKDFRNGSQLIVGEGDMALFYDSHGGIVASFTKGEYSLTTSNYPFVDKWRAAFSGGVNAYQYSIFFIKAREITNLKWGTPEPVDTRFTINNPVYDALVRGNRPIPAEVAPIYDVLLPVQMRGNYSIKIVEPKEFIQKFGGTSATERTQEQLDESVFGPRLIEGITDKITDAVAEIHNGLEIQRCKGKISERLLGDLEGIFSKWGVRLTDFRIEVIKIKEDNKHWQNILRAYNDVSAKQMDMSSDAVGEMAGLGIQGNNWQRIQARNLMRDMVNNPGAGGIAATGAGLGMGMVAGGVMGNMAAAMFSPMQEPVPQQQPTASVGPSRFAPKATQSPTPTPAGASVSQIKCPHCGEVAGVGKFCGNCGQPLPQKSMCPGCGGEVPAGFKFCPNCGTKVS